jgi:hypothetical protein
MSPKGAGFSIHQWLTDDLINLLALLASHDGHALGVHNLGGKADSQANSDAATGAAKREVDRAVLCKARELILGLEVHMDEEGRALLALLLEQPNPPCVSVDDRMQK